VIRYLKEAIGAGGKPKISRAEVLAARPIRNPVVQWERGVWHEERPAVVLLRVPRRRDRWGNLVARVFKLPPFRKIELDEMGSDVWEMCDGDLSVDALTRAVCAKYHLNRRQAEASVTAYMRMLAERRLLALKTGPSRGGSQAAASSTATVVVKEKKAKHERTGRAAPRR
jgi:hypothetical protein